jgi:protocatechuate 3,4-dioxygenase beta subunit
MDGDDREIGRILSRREALAVLGTGGAVMLGYSRERALSASISSLAATETPCLVRPQQTEGPYFSDGQVERSDIRTDPSTGIARPGVPLRLAFHVTRPRNGECSPLEGMRIDIWHCDALGRYSDFRREGTAGQQFLRGYQVTGSDGRVQFTTIYPGWYEGRTVHIHFKIRTDPVLSRSYDFTSQLYFPDSVTDQVHRLAPYATKGARRIANQQDGIFRHGGSELTLSPITTDTGYVANFELGLQLP